MNFENKKVSHITMSRVCHNYFFNHSFLLTLALKTRTCIITLSVPALLKFDPDLIEILVAYRFADGFLIGNRCLYYIHFHILNAMYR